MVVEPLAAGGVVGEVGDDVAARDGELPLRHLLRVHELDGLDLLAGGDEEGAGEPVEVAPGDESHEGRGLLRLQLAEVPYGGGVIGVAAHHHPQVEQGAGLEAGLLVEDGQPIAQVGVEGVLVEGDQEVALGLGREGGIGGEGDGELAPRRVILRVLLDGLEQQGERTVAFARVLEPPRFLDEVGGAGIGADLRAAGPRWARSRPRRVASGPRTDRTRRGARGPTRPRRPHAGAASG